MRSTLVFSLLSLPLLLLAACSASQMERVDGLNPSEERNANLLAVDVHPLTNDPLRAQLGSFFLVEHFDVAVNPTMVAAIKAHQPGGLIFWNPHDADPAQLRAVTRTYSSAAKAAGHPTLLLSADDEGGNLELAPSGRMIAGIQRFKKGFTALAHPVWLGRSEKEFGTELCALHGEILARELVSVGLNYPLTVTSDLSERLFAERGVSTDPSLVTNCLEAAAGAFAAQKDIVFVTKHFPGLGSTVGDSHDTVALSRAKTVAQMQPDLTPFKNVIAEVNAKGTWPSFSILASHGSFPALDSEHITTESPTILQGLLRQSMGFKGLLVSDAMWMGSYGQLRGDALMVVYVKAFLAGMDMLMVPGSKFAQAVTFFRQVYDGEVAPQTEVQLEQETGLSREELREKFVARMQESLAHLASVRGTLKPAVDVMDAADDEPASFTKAQRARYDEILEQLDSRWADVITQRQVAM